MSPLGEARRGSLLAAKAAALAARVGILTADDGVTSGFPDGATWLGGDGSGLVLCEAATVRTLGAALVWSQRHRVGPLEVVVDRHAGDLARRASWFVPPVRCWQLRGADGIDEAQVEQLVDPSPIDTVAAAPLVDVLVDAGLDVVVEHGRVVGEVRGLEVARVVADPDSPTTARIEVGIGRFDREASAMVNSERTDAETVLAAADLVRSNRGPGAPPTHPLNTMARSRWLRRLVLDDPASVGAAHLDPVDVTAEAPNTRDTWPAAAAGARADGSAVIVVCCTAGDVDALVMAADTRGVRSPDADLVVVSDSPLPAPIADVNERMSTPARLVAVTPPWA